MLLIAGSVRIDATHRDDVIATAIEVLRELRKQVGCTHVALSADLEDPGVLHLIQRWESRDALLANISARPVSGIAKHAGKIGLRELALLSYDVVSVGPVGPGEARRPGAAAASGPATWARSASRSSHSPNRRTSPGSSMSSDITYERQPLRPRASVMSSIARAIASLRREGSIRSSPTIAIAIAAAPGRRASPGPTGPTETTS